MVKKWLKEIISNLYPDIEFDILTPPDDKMGDYSTNLAFILAKIKKTSPMEAGRDLIEKLSNDKKFSEKFKKIELALPGFVNFYLSEDYLQKQLADIGADSEYGSSKDGRGKKVIVEYSSPNIAKPMHIGHLRSTIIGDALANIYESLGYEVVRWNYIGDWGTQFGKLIAAYKKWGNEEALEKNPIQELLRLYVKFHDELKNNPELEKEGQLEFQKLENDDIENRKIWEKFRRVSISEFSKTYAELNIGEFQVTKGESDYESELKPLIEYLIKQGIAKESEGALIIELPNLSPAMLRKSDGATLYFTRDLASLGDRINTYHPVKILYVVANQQALHFEQLFAVAKIVKLDSAELIHVKFGMVLGEDGKKLATREGKVISLQEVIDRITALARETVKQKNSDLSPEEIDKVAHVVGMGALKYNDLRQHPYSDITFDWKAMLDLSGNSGPYIQYTYARLANILNKAEKYDVGDLSTLTEPSVRRLTCRLLDFSDAIVECTKFYTLNGLALYLYELAHSANQFYEQIHILKDDNIARRDARLTLIQAVATVLKRGLNLLGIEVLERI